MKKTVGYTFHYIIILLLSFAPLIVWADEGDPLDQKIEFSKYKGTVYELLQQVSESSGYLFVYDSQIIDNNKVVKIPKREYTLREAIYTITKNTQIKIKIVDNHILLSLSADSGTKSVNITHNKQEEDYFGLSGNLRDRITDEYIPSVAISLENTGIGTIANQDGHFKLILPDSLKNNYIRFSHLGYESRAVPASLLAEENAVFYLEPKIIPLQEVVVRVVNPLDVLRNMLEKRELNYALTPVQITAFYREGVSHKNKNINITEAVLAIYKTGVQNTAKSDQVKLLKMRRIIDKQETDTLLPKMKSGINSCLLLDVMKEGMPDFLNPDNDARYTYTYTDITIIDDRRVNVISFEPKTSEYLLYGGKLYICAESQALLQVTFEVPPVHISQVTDMFILKQNKAFNLTAQRIEYTITYKPLNGVYYINHIRGDLYFKVRRKKRLFSSTLHMWFEMVNCQIDVVGVVPFARRDKIPTDDIFSDKKFDYDESFWGNFNTIMLEDELKTSILKILKKSK